MTMTAPCVEVSELLSATAEAFDHVVDGNSLTMNSSLKGRLILRMKRWFVLRAVERYIQTSGVCVTIENVADEVLNESARLNLIHA